MVRLVGGLRIRVPAVILGLLAIILALGAEALWRWALADEVAVKGTILRGTVVGISAGGVELKTDYGSGTLTIPFDQIESIKTDRPRHVFHGDQGEAVGRVLGVEDGKLIVGEDLASAARVDVKTIVVVDTAEEVEGSLAKRLRYQWRYWSGAIDAGLSFSESTVDELDITMGMRIERRKKPTRFLAQGSWLFGRDRPEGEESRKTDNELRGLLRGEYDLSDRMFLWTSHDFEYDEIDQLSLRYVGKGGPGYRIFDTPDYKLQVETGVGYIHERFFGGDSDEFVAIAFGVEGSATLFFGWLLRGRFDYLPDLSDWANNYLLRGELSLSAPLTAYLSFKWSVVDTYDNTPAPDVERNELKILLTLGARF
ncbi:MAG TPA: DUF481 domain-containing protein [Methylomirabilota bacterium]|nr:DUF481 domain-containing protein [Methylomirabilota bacterium]